MPGALEYDEEDGLFDDGDDFEILAINPAVPISGPSRTRTIGSTRPDVTSLSVGDTGGNAIAGPSRPRARPQSIPQPALTGGRSTSTSGTAAYPALPPTAPRQNNHGPIVDTDYIIALQRRRLHTPEPAPDVGVPSLRNRCLAVCKANSGKIYDVGDTEYSLVADFVDLMPMEQLVEVEEASPHLRKDTDWLWEVFLLSDYPAYHESVAWKRGVKRTSGWRRMYKSATVEAETRRQHAAERVAEKYKEIAEHKAARKIKVLDTLPTAKKRSGGGAFGKGPVVQKPGILGKLQADTKRHRISLTHAVGRHTAQRPSVSIARNAAPYRPPVSPQTSTSASTTTTNHIVGSRTVEVSRLPAPKRLKPTSISDPSGAAPRTAVSDPRATLPAHLATAIQENAVASRSNIYDRAPGDKTTAPIIRPIHRPQVENFRPPAPQVKKIPGSFFSSPLPQSSNGAKRRKSEPVDGSGAAEDGVGNGARDSQFSGGGGERTVVPSANAASQRTGSSGLPNPEQLSGVLFRKKQKLAPGLPRNAT